MVRGPAVALLLAALTAAGTPAAAPAAPPQENPCVQATWRGLRCPDLVMSRPADVAFERTPAGRLLLRSTSSLDNVGTGPLELAARRVGPGRMHARQRIERRRGTPLVVPTAAQVVLKDIPYQGGFWKLHAAARLEVWSLDARGVQQRLLRSSPKLDYCLRDLQRTRDLPRAPAREVFPACNQDPGALRVRLGTSVGWSDIYPATYDDQWIDVTGLRGRVALVHVADPGDVIFESDETDNAARVIVDIPG